jgi:3-polyprenyl-4-hydroxybenzoate decarboxylase
VTQDLEVPANAEMVIEGWFDPNEHRLEGPFGDHTGFYTPQDLFPVMHVTAITHRANAVYPTTIVGKPPMEDVWMGKATERLFLPLMKLFQGEIADVNMPPEGIFHNLVLVSIKKRYPGHAQKVMYGLWGLGLMMLAKCLVVVDADVNVQNLEDVAREVLQNVDWRRDVTLVDGPVDQLDHSAIMDSYGGKIGIDATRKPHRAAFASPDRAPAERVSARVGQNWRETHGTLIVGLDKSRLKPKDAMNALWDICPEHNIVVLDPFVDVRNLSDVAWRTLGNVDWRRDIEIQGGPVDHFDTGDNRVGNRHDATSKVQRTGIHAAGRRRWRCCRRSRRWWIGSGRNTGSRVDAVARRLAVGFWLLAKEKDSTQRRKGRKGRRE